METLVVVAHHRDHHEYYSGNDLTKSGSFSSAFSGINCRTFHSGAGLLPTPPKRGFSGSFSPRTPSPSVSSRNPQNFKRIVKSRTLPIPIKINFDRNERFFNDDFHFSERWAGPAYSNSPPASSLPIPKFSLQPKKTKSLNSATARSEIDLHFVAKSAPVTPIGDYRPSANDLFGSADTATDTLRRILNLDIADE